MDYSEDAWKQGHPDKPEVWLSGPVLGHDGDPDLSGQTETHTPLSAFEHVLECFGMSLSVKDDGSVWAMLADRSDEFAMHRSARMRLRYAIAEGVLHKSRSMRDGPWKPWLIPEDEFDSLLEAAACNVEFRPKTEGFW